MAVEFPVTPENLQRSIERFVKLTRNVEVENLGPYFNMALKTETAKLKVFFSQAQNAPAWATTALGELGRHRALMPEDLSEVNEIKAEFESIKDTPRQLAQLREGIIRDALGDFVLSGEALRVNVRNAVDPQTEGAKEFLAELGTATTNEYSGVDTWLRMTIHIPANLLREEGNQSMMPAGPYWHLQDQLKELATMTAVRIEAANAEYDAQFADNFAAIVRDVVGQDL